MGEGPLVSIWDDLQGVQEFREFSGVFMNAAMSLAQYWSLRMRIVLLSTETDHRCRE
jgi:hypothetical protein